jgi:hypothetical protein
VKIKGIEMPSGSDDFRIDIPDIISTFSLSQNICGIKKHFYGYCLTGNSLPEANYMLDFSFCQHILSCKYTERLLRGADPITLFSH